LSCIHTAVSAVFYGIAAISDQAARFMFFAACSQPHYLLC
jgi:hypothetical protein